MRERIFVEILKILKEGVESGGKEVIGARRIADELRARGYEMDERVVRYYLAILDKKGFTKREGYAGRRITPLGLQELKEALIEDRLNHISVKIEELMYKISYEPHKKRGEIAVNLSLLKEQYLERALDIMRDVAEEGCAFSRYKVFRADEDNMRRWKFIIPSGSSFVGIITPCNITVDGVLLKRGIPVEVEYSGIFEVRGGDIESMEEMVRYDGTTIDPVRIFMGRRMHTVSEVVKEGEGKIIVNYRRVPRSAREDLEAVLREMERIGMMGRVKIEEKEDGLGIFICAGINAIAAVEEAGIKTKTETKVGVFRFEEMEEE
ncbi:MAG: NrpR regulatory domain-containing protein [Candidatus Methanospirareceae archaeon]